MRIAVLAVVGCLMAVAFGPGGQAWAADDSAPAMRPLVLSRAVFALKEGEVWAEWGQALLCDIAPRQVRWVAGNPAFSEPRLMAVFDEELRQGGLKSGAADSLFSDRAAPGGLQVGAVIKDMHGQICSASYKGYANTRTIRGQIDMTVEWQVFDPLRREVIARVTTVARGEQRDRTSDGLERIVINAFRENAQALMAKSEFRQIALAPAEPADKRAMPADRSTLLLAFAKPARTPIAQAAGSVVTVLVEGAHGSGFLISPDGYLLTNRHVVGDAKLVRIRWSDGFETDGEVLRSDKRRDVALIKSSAHSRQPLFLRPSLAQQGDAVFAVGTPLEEQLAGTVTRGVVSAYRVDGGLNFLQSDVGINHGNSGGPLLDENGAVIGIAESGLFVGQTDATLGINRFIPIGDALEFLAIKPAP